MKANKIYTGLLVGACIIILAFSGCKKESSKASNNTSSQTKAGGISQSSPYFLTGLMNGKAFTIKGNPSYYAKSFASTSDSIQMQYSCNGQWNGARGNGQPGTGNGGGQGNGPGQDQGQGGNGGTVYITGANWTLGGSSADSMKVQGTLELRQLSVRVYVAPIADPTSQFYNVLVPNNNYLFLSNANPNNGVVISILDSNGTLWTTNGDQSNSTFQLTSIGSQQEQYTQVSGVVNATLYDGAGNSATLTNAAFTTLVGL